MCLRCTALVARAESVGSQAHQVSDQSSAEAAATSSAAAGRRLGRGRRSGCHGLGRGRFSGRAPSWSDAREFECRCGRTGDFRAVALALYKAESARANSDFSIVAGDCHSDAAANGRCRFPWPPASRNRSPNTQAPARVVCGMTTDKFLLAKAGDEIRIPHAGANDARPFGAVGVVAERAIAAVAGLPIEADNRHHELAPPFRAQRPAALAAAPSSARLLPTPVSGSVRPPVNVSNASDCCRNFVVGVRQLLGQLHRGAENGFGFVAQLLPRFLATVRLCLG